MSKLADFLPARRDEAFKYTSLAALARREYAAPVPGAFDESALPEALGTRLVFVDGVLADESRHKGAAPTGKTATSEKDRGSGAMRREPELARISEDARGSGTRAYARSLAPRQEAAPTPVTGRGSGTRACARSLAPRTETAPTPVTGRGSGAFAPRTGVTIKVGDPTRASATDDALRVMNAALATERVTIAIAPDTEAGVLELVFVTTDHADRFAAHPQVAIEIGAGAKATIIERHLGTGDAQDFLNLVTDLDLHENAQADHILVQQAPLGMTLTTGVYATLAAGTRFDSHAVQLGGALVRADIAVRLAGRDARCGLYGLHLPGLKQHIDTHSRIEHAVADTASDEHYRAVVDRGGRSVFNGMVIVEPGADRSDARQHNANLLLSEQAEADTKPELQIHADDVKCSHGATVGRIDETALFYLRSRGIGEDAARSLLVWAFAEAVLARIPLGALRRTIEDAVLARLPDSERIREFR